MVNRMPAPTVSYLICSTPRTGSSLLCDALTATGVAGRPEEYFQFRARTGYPRRPQEYFEGVDDREIFEATAFVAFRLAFSTVNDALGAAPDKQLADDAPHAVRDAVSFGRPPA